MSAEIKRDIEKSIQFLLKSFPAVALLGARQVGKSTLLKNLPNQVKFYDLERASDYEKISDSSQLELILQDRGKELIAFDEAQLCPSLFSALRVSIDESRDQNGQFILTGSSSPHLIKNISESLAGRIAILEVPQLTWNEALEKKQSKFYEYLSSPEKFKTLKNLYSRQDIEELCFTGLYPEPFLKRKKEVEYRLWLENYIKTYIERDIRSLFPQLQLDSYKRFIKMLSVSSGELFKASNFAKSLDVANSTIKKYIEIAEGTYLWRNLNCYSKNTKKRLVKTHKGYIRDTSIVNYLLNVNSKEDLLSHPAFGQIWESFVIEQIIKNIQNQFIRSDFYFYRTHHQAEIDLILEGEFGLVPIEIKSGAFTKKFQLIALKSFIEEQDCKFGIVINNASEICRLDEKIYQIPVNYI